MSMQQESQLDPDAITIIDPPVVDPEPTIPKAQPRTRSERTFTEADVERIRKEEKDKLYARIGQGEEAVQKLAEIEAQLSEQEKAKAKLEKEAATAAKKKAEEEMDLRQLIESQKTDFEERINQERAERERLEAVYNKEREFAGLREYLITRVAEESEPQEDEAGNLISAGIMPQLRQYISGNSQAEIDAAIEQAKHTTAEIMGSFQTQMQVRQAQYPTVSASGGPPIGPLEATAATRSLSPADIKNMSMEDYAAQRAQLMEGARRQRQGG